MASSECRANGTFTVDGTSAGIPGRSRDRTPGPDRIDIHVTGTFGSGTVKLQYSVDGGTTKVDVPADKEANVVSLAAAGVMTIKARYPLLFLNLAGSTSPSITWVAF